MKILIALLKRNWKSENLKIYENLTIILKRNWKVKIYENTDRPSQKELEN